MNASYNNVPMWDYGALFKAFGPEVSAKAFKVSTAAELDALLSDPSFSNADYPQVSSSWIREMTLLTPCSVSIWSWLLLTGRLR